MLIPLLDANMDLGNQGAISPHPKPPAPDSSENEGDELVH